MVKFYLLFSYIVFIDLIINLFYYYFYNKKTVKNLYFTYKNFIDLINKKSNKKKTQIPKKNGINSSLN